MGQLERYGLYVLVVVIFLILGVAIWGGEEGAVVQEPVALTDQQPNQPLKAPVPASERLSDFFMNDEDLMDAAPEPDPVVERASVQPREAAVVVTPEPAPERRAVVVPTPAPVAHKTYTVQRGDSWSRISKKFYGSERYFKELKRANNASGDHLMQGEEIIIPLREEVGSKKAAAAGSKGGTYTVKSGDSPARISRRLYGTERHAQAIMDANGITNPLALRIGQELKLPVVDQN